MTDLKTVASALHHCIVTDSIDNKCVDGCIYADSCDACKYDSSNEFVISEQLVRDALSLLVKQNNKIIELKKERRHAREMIASLIAKRKEVDE